MRYRVRGKLPTGQPIIVKPDADDPFMAAAAAGKLIREAGHNASAVTDLKVTALEKAKSSIYVGTVPSSKKGRKRATATAAATTAVDPAPAAVVATEPATEAAVVAPAAEPEKAETPSRRPRR
jgi:hypothetical protein